MVLTEPPAPMLLALMAERSKQIHGTSIIRKPTCTSSNGEHRPVTGCREPVRGEKL
jgi:hypothetical protein